MCGKINWSNSKQYFMILILFNISIDAAIIIFPCTNDGCLTWKATILQLIVGLSFALIIFHYQNELSKKQDKNTKNIDIIATRIDENVNSEKEYTEKVKNYERNKLIPSLEDLLWDLGNIQNVFSELEQLKFDQDMIVENDGSEIDVTYNDELNEQLKNFADNLRKYKEEFQIFTLYSRATLDIEDLQSIENLVKRIDEAIKYVVDHYDDKFTNLHTKLLVIVTEIAKRKNITELTQYQFERYSGS